MNEPTKQYLTAVHNYFNASVAMGEEVEKVEAAKYKLGIATSIIEAHDLMQERDATEDAVDGLRRIMDHAQAELDLMDDAEADTIPGNYLVHGNLYRIRIAGGWQFLGTAEVWQDQDMAEWFSNSYSYGYKGWHPKIKTRYIVWGNTLFKDNCGPQPMPQYGTILEYNLED